MASSTSEPPTYAVPKLGLQNLETMLGDTGAIHELAAADTEC